MNRVKRKKAGDLYIQEPTLYDKNYIVYLVVDAGFCLMDLEKFRSINKSTFYLHLKECEFRYNNKEIKTGYLLSAKDFNMLDNLKDLEEAGVDVLKIEGRARRPYYVGVATRIYKQALSGEKYNLEDLMLGFNRGYTAGYFDGNGEIISNKQNHIGIKIGKVEKFKTGKKFNEIYISSNYNLTPKSTLKFYNNNVEVATISAFDLKQENDLYKITSTQKVNVGDNVNLIRDFELENTLLNSISKRNIEIKIMPLPPVMVKLLNDGGLVEHIKKNGDFNFA